MDEIINFCVEENYYSAAANIHKEILDGNININKLAFLLKDICEAVVEDELEFLCETGEAMSKFPYPKTVKEAATMLDLAIPGWYNKIDLNTLNISSCTRCVIGQIFGLTIGKVFQYDSKLFNLFEYSETHLEKTPFGTQTNRQEWVDEILCRRKVKNDSAEINISKVTFESV